MMTLQYEFGDELVDALPAWLMNHPELATAYLDEIIEMGGSSNINAATLALEEIRMGAQYRSLYDSVFVGNRREDGSLRMTEGTYFTEIQDMRSFIRAVGINPDLFSEEYGILLGSDVTAGEFGDRVNAMYTSVLDALPETRAFYADNYAIDLSDAAILASMMSPDKGTAILLGQITNAQIGGEAAARGFDIEVDFADMLAGAGADREAAAQFFGEAASLMPALNIMAARHADPDDDFDLTDLADLSFFDDPNQRRRMNRLMAQESSTFTGGAQIEFMRSQAGGVTGLMDV